jgi:hypothetical protein
MAREPASPQGYRAPYHAGVTVLTAAAAATDHRPSTALIVLCGLLALLVVGVWPLTRYVVTIAHEGGHAITGAIRGRSVRSIAIYANGDGLTEFGKPATALMALSGYLGPSVFGLLGALMVGRVPGIAVLVIALVFLVLMLLQANTFVGIVAALASGGILYAATRASSTTQTVAAYTLVWFLLIGGFWRVVERNAQRRGGAEVGDAVALRGMTHLPAGLWMGVWWLLTLGALVLGAGLMLGLIDPPRG